QFGLHAGDTLTVKTFAPRDRAAVYANHYDHPHGPVYRFRIAAVVRSPQDVALDQPRRAGRDASYGGNSGIIVPSAFNDRNRGKFLSFGDSYDVQLAPSTSLLTFKAAVNRLSGGAYFGPPRFAERRSSFDTPVNLETTALLALGIATAF